MMGFPFEFLFFFLSYGRTSAVLCSTPHPSSSFSHLYERKGLLLCVQRLCLVLALASYREAT